MRIIEKTAVGIDISEEHISIAMLRAGKKGIELVKSATMAMPEGAVSDGNITDSLMLTKAIKELKHRCKIHDTDSAVSIFAKPVVVQIIDMPKQMPPNIRQYVQGEVRNCVVLPSRDIVLDFCPIGTAKRTASSANSPHAEKRVIAAAAEEARMLELVKVCGKAGLRIEAIEPALFAYMRGLYSQKVAGKNSLNVLMGILCGTTLNLCVFKNGSVDFIRTKEFINSSHKKSPDSCPAFGKSWDANVEECKDCGEVFPDEFAECKKITQARRGESNDFNDWLATELSDVVKFYDIEVSDAGKWDVTLFLDNHKSAKEMEKCLKAAIPAGRLQIRTLEDACLDTPIGSSITDKTEKPSPVAVGLAMRFLTAQSNDVKINLVPHRVIKTREVKREALVAANIIAMALFVMVVAISGFAFMIQRVNYATTEKKQLVAKVDTEKMLEQQEQFDGRLSLLSARVEKMSQISSTHNDVNWVEVLEGIKNATPGSVLITSISSQDGLRINVEGLAVSNEAVNLFVGLLEKANFISSVTLLEARKQDGQKELIIYQLSCKLANRSGKAQNVS